MLRTRTLLPPQALLPPQSERGWSTSTAGATRGPRLGCLWEEHLPLGCKAAAKAFGAQGHLLDEPPVPEHASKRHVAHEAFVLGVLLGWSPQQECRRVSCSHSLWPAILPSQIFPMDGLQFKELGLSVWGVKIHHLHPLMK